MESKITLRDIFSYFLVGFYFLVCLASTPLGLSNPELGITTISKFLSLVIEASKEISSAVLLLVPMIYLIGVIVHGVDNMVQVAAMLPFQLVKRHQPSRAIKIILSLFFGSWAPYRAGLNALQGNSGSESMYGQGQVYWMIAFQANEGFYRVSWLYALYHLCFTQDWLKVGIFLFLILLFWLRASIIMEEDLLQVESDKKA